MKVLVLYYSQFGNTARIARAVAAVLPEPAHVRVTSLSEVRPADLVGLSWLIVGVPTHFRDVPRVVAKFLNRVPRHGLGGVRVAVFDTRYRMTRWLSGSAAHKLARRVHRLGAALLIPPESFFVVDREGPLAEGEVERATAWGRAVAASLARPTPGRTTFDRWLYLRWVWANGWSELVGLGATVLLGWWIIHSMGAPSSALAVVATGFGAIGAGTALEGVLVGYAQARALRPSLRAVSSGGWIVATALGAGAAWTLGMLPSTAMALVRVPAEAVESPPAWLEGPGQYLLAAGMGMVLGPVLAFPQALVLRRHTRRWAAWIPANALAWALGMPVVFAGVGLVPPGAGAVPVIVTVAATCLVAGLVVGVAHGLVLVRLVATADAAPEIERRAIGQPA
jgi:flavodoxin